MEINLDKKLQSIVVENKEAVIKFDYPDILSVDKLDGGSYRINYLK